MPSSAASKDYKFESNSPATTPNSGGETLAQELQSQKIDDAAIKSVQHRTAWQIKGSALSLNTHNRIRNIVEALQIKPNPQKPMIPLSIGELV